MATDLKSDRDKTYDPENGDKRSSSKAGWRPPGYDKDNSGYNTNDPKSKVNKDDVASKEKDSGTNGGNKSAVNDKEFALKNDIPMTNALGKGFTGKEDRSNNKKKGMSTRKKIGLAFATFGVVSTIVATIMGPSLLINNMRDILTGKIGELQNNHSRTYRRKKMHKVADLFSKDGRIGGRVIVDMEAHGYVFSFDPDEPNKIRAITPPGSNQSYINNDLGGANEVIDDFVQKRHPFRSSKWKTKRMNAFYSRYKILKKSPVVATADDIDGDPDATVRRNVAQSTFNGDEGVDDLRASSAELNEGETATTTEADDAVKKNQGVYDDAKAGAIRDGADVDKLDNNLRSIIRGIGRGADDDLFTAVKNAVAQKSLGGKVFSSLRGILDPTDLPARICTLKNRLKAGVTASRSTKALALMKQTLAIIAVSDAVRMGNADSSLLGSVLKRFTTSDANGLPFGAASGIGFALNGSFSKSQNNFLKPGYSVDGKTTGVIGGIQSATNGFPGTGSKACGVWLNPFTGIVAGIGQIVVSVFTFGAGGAGIQASIQGAKLTITTAFKKLTTRAVLAFVGKALLVELSFEGIMTLVQLYTEKQLAFPITGQSVGAEFGGEITAGAGVSTKQRSLQAGQVPATSSQYAQAYDVFLAEKKEEMQNTSIFARIFDYSNLDSLAFNTVSRVAFNTPSLTSAANSLSTTLLSAPSSIFSTFSRLISPSAYAQAQDEVPFDSYEVEGDGDHADKELAVDTAGNLLTVMPQYIIDADEVENERLLLEAGHIDTESKEPIGLFKEHVENCVDNIDTISVIEGGDSTNPAEDCLATQPLTRQFKIHLAYLDLKDGLEAEFIPDELDNKPSTSSDATIRPEVLFDASSLGNHSDTVQCAAGTTDLGVVTSKYTGSLKKTSDPLRIRICKVPDIPGEGNGADGVERGGGAVVNAEVSAAWQALALKAKADGVSLFANSSFRLADSCGGTGDGSACARPGKSIHQGGWAIDFANMSLKGTSTTSCSGRARLPSSTQWAWMEQNAESFGFGQYTYEAWHWDPAPFANRCGTGE